MGINMEYELRPVPAGEAGLCYTQLPGRDSETGCVGHILIDYDRDQKYSGKRFPEFFNEWFHHKLSLETQEMTEEENKVLSGLGGKGPLRDRDTMVEFCEQHPEAEIPGDTGSRGFRLDTKSLVCYVRCGTQPHGLCHIYFYDKGTLQGFLERKGPDIREQIRVTGYGDRRESNRDYAHQATMIQAAVPGLIQYAGALAAGNEEEKLRELREYLVHMAEWYLADTELAPDSTETDWAEKKYGAMVDKAAALARETGEAPALSGLDVEALYAGLRYAAGLLDKGESGERVSQRVELASKVITGLTEFRQANGMKNFVMEYELQPVPAVEAGLCYTQLPGQDAEIGCVGYMLLTPVSGTDFTRKWFPRNPELATGEQMKLFETVLDELRICGPLRDPYTIAEFAERRPEAEILCDVREYGFRLNEGDITCYMRCSTIPYLKSRVFLYDGDTLENFLEREGPDIRERVRAMDYGEICENNPDYAGKVAVYKAAIPGLMKYAAALAVRGDGEEVPELREYLINMARFSLEPVDTEPCGKSWYWAHKKYGEALDKAVAAALEAGEAPELDSGEVEALYAGLELYVREMICTGDLEDWVEQTRGLASELRQEWPPAAEYPELFAVQQAEETGPRMGGMT